MGGQGPAGSVLLIEADQEHEDEPLGQREPAPPPPRRGLALEPVTHSEEAPLGKRCAGILEVPRLFSPAARYCWRFHVYPTRTLQKSY